MTLWHVVLAVVGGLALLWVALVGALWFARPDDIGVRDALRLLPDVARLRRPQPPRADTA